MVKLPRIFVHLKKKEVDDLTEDISIGFSPHSSHAVQFQL
jgi:hypothetical protein